MIITYKKGTTLNGNTPTILYGYGGFDISDTPCIQYSCCISGFRRAVFMPFQISEEEVNTVKNGILPALK